MKFDQFFALAKEKGITKAKSKSQKAKASR
jgi:hypothetical protein